MTTSSQSRAPWRNLLTSHLDQTPGCEFSIATVGQDTHGRFVPRVRTCGCRGFFPELELHPSGQKDMQQQVEDGGNPACYESDMLSFTTDIRMEKLPQLDSSGHAIEAMFWLKDLMVQWRIKGSAFAIGSPLGEDDGREKASRGEIGNGLRVKEVPDDDVKKWTWERAVTKYFANHSPAMRGKTWYLYVLFVQFMLFIRVGSCVCTACCLGTPFMVVIDLQLCRANCCSGSFKVPPPGQPKSQAPSNPALGVGQKVTDLYDPVARENFRVVLIVPDEVEYLDLSDQANLRRWQWKLTDNDDKDGRSGRQWLETELWP